MGEYFRLLQTVKKLAALVVVALLWAAGAEAAFSWRTSKRGTCTSSPATCVVTEPTGVASGDWQFAIIAEALLCTVTTPAGWTQFGTASGTNANFYIYYVTGGRGASAPTLTFTNNGNAACLQGEWHTLGLAGSNVTIDTSATAALINSSTNPDPPASTANFTNDEAIAIGCNWAGATWTAPGTYTLRSLNTGGLDCAAASKDLSASGSENPATFTGPAAADNVWAATILIENSSPTAGGACTPTLTLLGVGRCG